MCKVRERDSYVVEFLLRFEGEDRKNVPYRDCRIFELDKMKALLKADELKNQLTQVIRRYFAGLNEFPIEQVLVELVKFERSETA